MTQEEKNTPITFGMLESILKEVEESWTPQINALNDAVGRRCDAYEKSTLALADTCSKTIEKLNTLRAFVIAAYAAQNHISVEKATQVYRDFATKFNDIIKETKEENK